MKTRNIILLALTALLAVSCHSWDDPAEDAGMNSYGNKDLKESNVVQIGDLLTKYKSEITSGGMKQITDACQIKAIVTSSDEGSNIYKNLYIVDGTGGLYLKIDKSSLYAEAAVGQCILVDLKGLWIGGYGQQPHIGGTPYTNNSGKLAIGNINRNTWAEHYKLIPDIEGLSAKPITTNDISALDIDKDFGKVVTLVGVKMKNANGTEVFAAGSSGSVDQEIAGQMSSVVVRTSTYAKFAKMVMPTEKINITGVISRFTDTWQILIRTISDIQPYTGNEKYDYYVEPVQPTEPSGEGTLASPYNVAAAIQKCQEIGQTASTEKYYVKGYVMADAEASDQYGNITINIADNKAGGQTFTGFQLAGSDGSKLPSGFKANKGDEVVIYGAIYNYNGKTPETVGKGAAIIYTINGKKTDGSDPSTSGGGDQSSDEVAPAGDGSQTSPFNIAAAIAKCKEIGKTLSTEKYYVKGIVVKGGKVSGGYGNVTFDMGDAATSTNLFKAYQVAGTNGAKLADGYEVKVGDEVVIYGPIYNYNDKTPETGGKSAAQIVTINGNKAE